MMDFEKSDRVKMVESGEEVGYVVEPLFQGKYVVTFHNGQFLVFAERELELSDRPALPG